MIDQLLGAAGLYGAYMAGALYLGDASARVANRWVARLPRTTIAFAAVLTTALIGQLQSPGLLLALQRDATRIANGEWWRIVTALFVQDGGLEGGVFNIAGLLLIGSVAESMVATHEWLIIALSAGLLSQMVGLRWQPMGAGNSVMNFGLASAVAVACLRRRPSRLIMVTAAASLASCAALLLRRDIHGAASLIGTMATLVLTL